MKQTVATSKDKICGINTCSCTWFPSLEIRSLKRPRFEASKLTHALNSPEGGDTIVHQGDIRRSYHPTKTHLLSGLIILCKCSKFKNFEDGHHSIIMHSPSASEEKWPPFNGGSWGTGLVRCNFHELTLLWDSIKPQKFPPQCTNNSPDYSIDRGCCKTQLEYIRKVNIPRCTRKTSC